MIVKDIMTREIVHVNSNTSIMEVIKLMRDSNLGFMVIKDNDKLSGVITDRDIIISLSYYYKLDDPISKIMKKNIITIDQYSDINDASDLLGNMQIRRLIVTNEDNKICGIISIADLARHILLEDNALEALTEISYDFSTKKDSLIHIETTML